MTFGGIRDDERLKRCLVHAGSMWGKEAGAAPGKGNSYEARNLWLRIDRARFRESLMMRRTRKSGLPCGIYSSAFSLSPSWPLAASFLVRDTEDQFFAAPPPAPGLREPGLLVKGTVVDLLLRRARVYSLRFLPTLPGSNGVAIETEGMQRGGCGSGWKYCKTDPAVTCSSCRRRCSSP